MNQLLDGSGICKALCKSGTLTNETYIIIFTKIPKFITLVTF